MKCNEIRKKYFKKIKPTKQEKKEILTGIETLKKTNSHDHTQAIIVRNNVLTSIHPIISQLAF